MFAFLLGELSVERSIIPGYMANDSPSGWHLFKIGAMA